MSIINILVQTTTNANLARQTRSNRNRNKSSEQTLNSSNEILITDNAIDGSPQLVSISNPHMDMMIEENSALSVLNSEVLLEPQSSVSGHVNNFSPISVDQRTHLILESGNSNSSTASSSSGSNSLLQRTQRPRKPMSSPTVATTNTSMTKPSLRSSSASGMK